MTDRTASFPLFDRSDYLRRCRASSVPRDIAEEMADDAEAKHDARVFLAGVFKHGLAAEGEVDEWSE